ncbi:toll/interleukin-1 receptor domain-containing protein [Actinoplanes oblitus]|uniref:Toll/interleukin-1 receptor domain-containing protein n=1 Tax=Actinoplanes oblitus TaxID=3040509 RepID=A0ABY8W6I7_9ACTN|nr:toll/interleukin-1 receptor domain-containing protein [Actinoplanes oblitus]WIM93430.1 toll/interleukin-1 receptor domain-containing protein [Actinoplanes oblitus]
MCETTPSDNDARPDFFISFTKPDQEWARWIVDLIKEVVNEDGQPCRALYQEDDFVPGTNWIHLIDKGLRQCRRVLPILSPAYLEDSQYGAAEWQAAWSKDPNGLLRHLVPVRVLSCQPAGLLGAIVHIDLVGLRKDAARAALLLGLDAAIRGPRRRRAAAPFPGPH